MSATASSRPWACRSHAGSAISPSSRMPSPALLQGAPKPRLQMLCHYQNIAAVAPPTRRARRARRARVARWRRDRRHLCPLRRRAADARAGDRHLRRQRRDADARHGASPRTGPATCPGPHGLPGGYPVTLRGGRLDLDLPAGTRSRARRSPGMRATRRRTGSSSMPTVVPATPAGCYERLKAESPDLAAGFNVARPRAGLAAP